MSSGCLCRLWLASRGHGAPRDASGPCGSAPGLCAHLPPRQRRGPGHSHAAAAAAPPTAARARSLPTPSTRSAYVPAQQPFEPLRHTRRDCELCIALARLNAELLPDGAPCADACECQNDCVAVPCNTNCEYYNDINEAEDLDGTCPGVCGTLDTVEYEEDQDEDLPEPTCNNGSVDYEDYQFFAQADAQPEPQPASDIEADDEESDGCVGDVSAATYGGYGDQMRPAAAPRPAPPRPEPSFAPAQGPRKRCPGLSRKRGQICFRRRGLRRRCMGRLRCKWARRTIGRGQTVGRCQTGGGRVTHNCARPSAAAVSLDVSDIVSTVHASTCHVTSCSASFRWHCERPCFWQPAPCTVDSACRSSAHEALVRAMCMFSRRSTLQARSTTSPLSAFL